MVIPLEQLEKVAMAVAQKESGTNTKIAIFEIVDTITHLLNTIYCWQIISDRREVIASNTNSRHI